MLVHSVASFVIFTVQCVLVVIVIRLNNVLCMSFVLVGLIGSKFN